MFACPNCRTRLGKQSSGEGPRWLCAACGGRAVHLPSLRCTPAGTFVRRLWALARNTPPEQRSRTCPICDKSMATVPTLGLPGSTEPLRLDVCVSCQFVWFDPSEHEAWVSASAHAATDDRLPAETRAALARLPPAPPPAIVAERDVSESELIFRTPPKGEGFELKYLICILGLPVVVDPPPLRHQPRTTPILAAVVTMVSLAMIFARPEATSMWAFVPAEMWRYGGLTLLTSFFLHVGFWHLIANMYFLVILGDNVEDLLGEARYLGLLLAGTVAGNVCHAAMDPTSRVPAMGASGGIAAVILYYGLMFPQGRLRVALRALVLDLRVWAALTLWLMVQLIGTIVQAKQGTRVSYAAHLGGSLAGLTFWFLYGRGQNERTLSVAASAQQ